MTQDPGQVVSLAVTKVCECGWQLPRGFITDIDTSKVTIPVATTITTAAFHIYISLWCPNCDKTHKVRLLDERLFIRLRNGMPGKDNSP